MSTKYIENHGFTLIELMIVVAIIGILAAIAVQNFMAYRNKSRVAASIQTTESIRDAVAGFAAVSPGSTFPQQAQIASWADLIALANPNGATLRTSEADQGISFVSYATWDTDGNGEAGDDYYFVFYVSGIPNDLTGSQIEIRPSGIVRQTHS